MSASERREQLLDVTKEVVGEDGFHAVSIEGVARRAGITRPVVYEHFGDLPGLLEAPWPSSPSSSPRGARPRAARARTCSRRCAATSRRCRPTR